MPYEVKPLREIIADAIDYVRTNSPSLTDFNAGSRVRSLLEAVARQVYDLYVAVHQGMRYAIRTAVYEAFGFPLLPARQASGYVRFSRSAPAGVAYPIPKGSIVSRNGPDGSSVFYETIEKGEIAVGQTFADVPVRAQIAGISGNCAENTITTLRTAPAGVEAVTNPAPLLNGTTDETEERRKRRFGDYIESLPRATGGALEYAARSVDGVTGAESVDTPYINALVYDASTDSYLDVSNEVNEPFGMASDAFPPVEAVGDAFFIGSDRKFHQIYVNLQTAGVPSGVTAVWEYWNGVAWASLSATDGTDRLTATGVVSFTKPADWAGSKIGDMWCFWTRLRLVAGSYTTNPKVYHAMLPPPPGWTELYVHKADGTADAALLNAVKAVVEPYRASGTKLNVLAPTLIAQDLTLSIRVAVAYDRSAVQEQVRQVIVDYLNVMGLGQSLILGMIEQQAYAVEGGSAVITCSVTAPAIDRLVSPGEIIRAGTVQVLVEN